VTSENMTIYRVLIIEDDKDIADIIYHIAAEIGFESHRATGITALTAYGIYAPHIIVLDILMPGRDGIEVLQFLKAQKSQAHIVILSGSSETYRDIAEKLGTANDLKIEANLAKPFHVTKLRQTLEKIKLSLPKLNGDSSTEAVA
jgi:CheY-like chemotaxis protein